MRIVKTCSEALESSVRVATNGINKVDDAGAAEHFFYTPLGVSAPNAEAAENIDTFNTWVLSNGGVYIGKYEIESTGAERTVAENQFFNLKTTTIQATKSLLLTAPLCACTSAELEKMSGRDGLIWEMTSKKYLRGEVNDDGTIQGVPVSIYKALNSIATTDAPWENTIFEIQYKNPRNTQQNPFQAPVTWNFSEVDQPFGIEPTLGNFIDAGANLTFDLTLNKDCTEELVNGLLQGNFKISDANGADIAGFTVTEAAGVYSFDVTTGESVVYPETNGIIQSAGLLYNMDQIRVGA